MSSDCPICYHPIDEQVHLTVCCHKFHEKCMESWLETSSAKSCPICRTSLAPAGLNDPDVDLPHQHIDDPEHCTRLSYTKSYTKYMKYKQKYLGLKNVVSSEPRTEPPQSTGLSDEPDESRTWLSDTSGESSSDENDRDDTL